MNTDLKQDHMKQQIEVFMGQLYLDVHGPTGTAETGSKLTEEYLIRLVTRFAVSICSAWYAISEIFDFIRNKRMVRDLSNGTLS